MYKSRLQELCQQRKWRLPEYNARKLGLDHNPRFSASVTINGVAFDTLQLFRSSKEAQNDAARLAFAHFSDPQPRHTNRSPSPSSFPQPSLPASSALPSTAGTNLTGTHDTKQTLQPKIQETHETSYVPVQFSGIASGGNSQANGSTLDIQHLYKNQLQTYAQKRNLLLPVYSCEREGLPRANRFKCRVTVDEHTYEGQEFLPTMKEAEHAVAKVALMSLLPNGIQEDDIGLYKNVLQELIQKEGFSMPVFSTKNSGEVHVPIFVSTVEIEGETFTGSEARSKKQAEISVAKVAYHTLRERKSSKIPLVRPPAQKGLETPEILSSSFQSNLATDLQQGRPNAPMIGSPSAITGEQTMENSVTAEGNSHHPTTVSSRPGALTTSSGFSSSDILYGRAQESNSSSLSVSRNGSSSTLPSDGSTNLAMDSTLEPPAKRRMYNKVSVYPYKSDMKFPEGNTVLPTSDEKWVALSHT